MDARMKFNLAGWVIVAVVFAIIFVLALSASCSQVQMSPAYRQELVMSNIIVQSLNEDCQAGDPNACSQGLAESAKILQLLVDAVEGTVSDEGIAQ